MSLTGKISARFALPGASMMVASLFLIMVPATAWGQFPWELIYCFDGEAASDQFGYSVSGAGDVDNDGYADLIVGAPYNDAGGSAAGRAYVYSGQTGGLLWTFTAEGGYDHFGYSVSGAGDVNNDGYDDLIVGANEIGAGGTMRGRAYVYSGQTGGLLWTFTGAADYDRLGSSVSGAGDVNNDSYDDLIVGAPYNDEAANNAGRAYVYSGQTGALLWTFFGEGSGDIFGISVSGAGDVNNDGYDDLIVGANSNDAGGSTAGRAYVFSGHTGGLLWTFTGESSGDVLGTSVSGAGDVNDDGFDDLIVGAPRHDAVDTDAGRAYVYSGQTGGVLWTFDGEAIEDEFGHSVSGAGDVNNDGYDDLIVGAYYNDALGGETGRAYVYSGQTGNLLHTFTGLAAEDYFGCSVSRAGDVNDDGYDDLMVGAFGNDAAGSAAGRAYVYSGECETQPNPCENINPEAGIIIQHDQIGHTWYDYQQNCSMGRMISVTPGGYRHFSWTYAGCVYSDPDCWRYVYANCKDPAGEYLDSPQPVDGGEYENAGYSNQGHLSDGRSVVVYHQVYSPLWSMLSIENSLGSGSFNRHWDIPDSIPGSVWGDKGYQSKLSVKNDYVHLVMNEAIITGGVPVMIAYQRCHEDANPDYLICQAYVNGATQTYTLYKNTNYSNPAGLVSPFDSSCSFTPVIEASPVSSRVAIAFVKPACDGSCWYLGDVAYMESMTNGDDWIDGSNYPPADYNLTNYGCGYPEDERACFDLNACYDYRDSLHVVWCTVGFPELEFFDPGVSKLYHWSKETGIGLITTAIWGGTNPGGHNANIAKMSISAVDPIHHPPDSVYLYCIWTQFDSGDTSDAGYGNGDIYGAGSRDGGATWGPSYNLTNTKTPGCLVGDCLSEHWSSMAQNMHNGALHIQYVCDKHPGFAMIGGDWESQWADNPIMYLELEAWVLGTWLERGDANADGTIDLGDAVYILNYLFKGGPPPNPPDSGDANCDGMVELGDAIYLLNYLFKGGPPPGCP